VIRSFKIELFSRHHSIILNTTDLLNPEAIRMMAAIAEHGSMAKAARSLGLVPSSLTYRVRQIEDALDVLLFDRSSRQAKLTAAGSELLREGSRVMQDLHAVANRVKRVATGWEPQIDIAVDSIIVKSTVLELVEAFFTLGAPTRVRLRDETLSGTWQALVEGKTDLAIGVVADTRIAGIKSRPMGEVPFVFAVAPHHPLASFAEPLTDEQIKMHRIVAVADSSNSQGTMSVGILSGQDVLTVADMTDKLQAQLRGLGCGNLPECIAKPYIDSGRLVVKQTNRPPRTPNVSYAWRDSPHLATTNRALQWWLDQLASPKTQAALLNAPSIS
jgi:DNA-binding transcriptional LysR family regulator